MHVRVAQGMIAERFDDAARQRRAALASRNHALELLFKTFELFQAGPHCHQIVPCDRISLCAGPFGLVREVQQRADLVEFEAQLPRMTNETQPPQLWRAEKSAAALRPRRHRQQPLRLIKPNCWDLNAGELRRRANRVHFRLLLL